MRINSMIFKVFYVLHNGISLMAYMLLGAAVTGNYVQFITFNRTIIRITFYYYYNSTYN